jgi:putative peptidoglycan lipid II flippase
LGAMINATWLWRGLRRRQVLRHGEGWAALLIRVSVASAGLGAWLAWGAQAFNWSAPDVDWLLRLGALAGLCFVGALVYLGALAVMGFPLRELMQRKAVASALDAVPPAKKER